VLCIARVRLCCIKTAIKSKLHYFVLLRFVLFCCTCARAFSGTERLGFGNSLRQQQQQQQQQQPPADDNLLLLRLPVTIHSDQCSISFIVLNFIHQNGRWKKIQNRTIEHTSLHVTLYKLIHVTRRRKANSNHNLLAGITCCLSCVCLVKSCCKAVIIGRNIYAWIYHGNASSRF